MAPLVSEVEVAGLSLGTARKATNGIVTQPLIYQGNRQTEFQLDGEVTGAYNLSSFDGSNATRLTASFTIDSQQQALLTGIESAVAALAGATSLRSNVKLREGFPPLFKCKVDTERLQCFDASGAETKAPGEWAGVRFKVIVSPRSYYKQAQGDGVIWDLVAVQILGAVAPQKPSFRKLRDLPWQ